jgi:hypothetical protein
LKTFDFMLMELRSQPQAVLMQLETSCLASQWSDLRPGSRSIAVRADIVSGASRSFYVSLESAGDLVIEDTQYVGANVAIDTSGSNPNVPRNAGTISITQGTVSITKDSSFDESDNVTSAASNVTIAQYKIKAFGEDMKIRRLDVTITEGAGNVGLNNVALYADGGQVGSTQNLGTTAGATTLQFTLGSSLIVPLGQEVVLEVRADTNKADNSAFTGNITTGISIAAAQAQGMTSKETNSGAVSSANTTVTASAASATFAENVGVVDQTISDDVTGAKIGSFVLQAGNSEGVRVTNVLVAIDGANASTTAGPVETTDLANITISTDGGATMLSPKNPQASNNFAVDFTVATNQSKTIDVYADITGATDGETIDTTVTLTARGASSNVTISGLTKAGQTMTIGTGAVNTITVVSSNETSAQYIVGDTDNPQPLVRYNVKSTGGDAKIETMTFNITGSTAGAITMLEVEGEVGSCPARTAVGNSVVLTGCDIVVPLGGAGTDILVSAYYGTVGTPGIASDSDALAHLVSVEYAPVGGGTSATFTSTAATSSTMKVVASIPTLEIDSVSPSNVLANGSVKIGTITVSAGTGGPINLDAIPLNIVVSGGANIDGASTTNAIYLQEGNTTIATTDNLTTDVTSAAGVITFTNDEKVLAGQSKTYDVYAVFEAVTGGDDSAQFSLASASSLVWDDLEGAGNDLSGTLINNYPSNVISVTD